MCGIVGIASNSNCTNALIEGLKKLAYRGYDSAGLATLVNNEIVKRVALGKIGNLELTVKWYLENIDWCKKILNNQSLNRRGLNK